MFNTLELSEQAKSINQAYKAIKDDDRLGKSKEYYTSLDTESGALSDATKLASKVINDLEYLDMHGNLCGSFSVTAKANQHDFGTYYSVEVYRVLVETESDDLYDIVEDYMQAGRAQLEQVIAKYQN